MKTYTTKANANRYGKKLAERHDSVESFDVVQMADAFVLTFICDCTNDDVPQDVRECAKEYTCKIDEKKHEEVTGEKAETAAPIKRKSDIENPCEYVWTVCENMVPNGARRKDVIAYCVENGVAFYTARTQYQLWKKATEV